MEGLGKDKGRPQGRARAPTVAVTGSGEEGEDLRAWLQAEEEQLKCTVAAKSSAMERNRTKEKLERALQGWHSTVLQSSNLWIGLECGEGEGEDEKKRNQRSEAKSEDNQAEAGTKPGAGSRVTQ
ncbi:unnamed protein product [Fusarium venenatum]|uniref:Uncharacterized protein n=1 Tax=Fusarium venenatum TaxID=56646 RepID=A0A2L2T522_9HYPO|nr:uncharacterized protein FVRRES_11659 [Fusarium venenatum]CEI38968.1 unnamed protein product [Fusarium venenatum]